MKSRRESKFKAFSKLFTRHRKAAKTTAAMWYTDTSN
jgi:hypothetical protein